jgi:hypothetical protein
MKLKADLKKLLHVGSSDPRPAQEIAGAKATPKTGLPPTPGSKTDYADPSKQAMDIVGEKPAGTSHAELAGMAKDPLLALIHEDVKDFTAQEASAKQAVAEAKINANAAWDTYATALKQLADNPDVQAELRRRGTTIDVGHLKLTREETNDFGYYDASYDVTLKLTGSGAIIEGGLDRNKSGDDGFSFVGDYPATKANFVSSAQSERPRGEDDGPPPVSDISKEMWGGKLASIDAVRAQLAALVTAAK